MKGLIIDEPWISKILKGEKTWEMRATSTSARGQVALIRKGSGAVVGVVEIVGSRGPLGLEELRVNVEKHCVPMEEFESGRAEKWTTAWELARAQALNTSVPYRHPAGAVIWVNLDADVDQAIRSQVRAGNSVRPSDAPRPSPVASLSRGIEVCSDTSMVAPVSVPAVLLSRVSELFQDMSMEVPVAKDGTWFGPHLLRAGYYTIGEKGDEQKVDNFHDAIRRLRTMQVARWRRPNAQDNWGIVSGVRWTRRSQLE